MLFELKLARRFIGTRRRSLARFTSVVAVAGIAAGVASLIFAQALARGFQGEMQEKILANTAHVSIFSKDGSEITNWRVIKADLEKDENIRFVAPTAYESALLAGERTTEYAVLRVIYCCVTDHGLDRTEVSIGAELAEKTGIKPGATVQIITVENGDIPKTHEVFVKDVFRTGLFEYDATWINISAAHYARLHGQVDFTPSFLSISVNNIYDAAETAAKIRGELGDDFRVLDWQEANQPLFAALSLERKAGVAIISLIIFIAALNITTTLSLLVHERRVDIGVLRTCGSTAKSLILVFMLDGLILGLIGVTVGVAAGLIGYFFANHFRLISLSAEVYSVNYIPLRVDPVSVLLIAMAALVICIAATIYPAIKASRIKPLDNLRIQ